MDESTATHIDELSRRVNNQARRIMALEFLAVVVIERLLALEAQTLPRFSDEADESEYWSGKCGLPT